MREVCATGESRSTGHKTSIRSVETAKAEQLKGYHIDVEQYGVTGTMKTGSRRSGSTRHFDSSRRAITPGWSATRKIWVGWLGDAGAQSGIGRGALRSLRSG